MIKKSTYIRSFTPVQRKQLEQVSKDEKIKTTTEVLLFALEKYLEQKRISKGSIESSSTNKTK